MNNITMSAVIVGVLFIMFYIPYLLAKGVSQIAYGKRLEAGILVKCWIPVYNIFYADKTYFGHIASASYGFICMIVFTLLRLVQWFFLYDNTILARIFIILFGVGIATWYICNCFTSFIIMKDSGAINTGKAILYSIVFPFGYFYIGQFLANVVSHKLSERSDKSWDEREDDEL